MPVKNNPQTPEDLNANWPLNSDHVKEGAAHIRGVKAVVKSLDTVVKGNAFPVGTKMLFQQTNAPTGWVKDTTHNNKALRVVTGTAGSGGSNAFTTAFNSSRTTSSNGGHSHTITVNNHTLAGSRMPSHSHPVDGRTGSTFLGGYGFVRGESILGGGLTDSAGGGEAHNHGASSKSTGAHTHALNLNVQYVDLIIATRQ